MKIYYYEFVTGKKPVLVADDLYEILCGNNLTKPKEEIKREKRKKRLGKKSLF